MADDEVFEQGNRFGRRQFLIAGAGAGFALTTAGALNYGAIARAARTPIAKHGKFKWGVASGMPAPQHITLWTRLGGVSRDSKLHVEVSTDKHFRHVIRRKHVIAKESRDFTVHTRIGGLKPHHEYFYRFETEHSHSRVGTFRTLPPADSHQKLRIGFYSCSSYEAGYFIAQPGLAQEKDLDLVLCLGDYIYEHHYYDGPAARTDKTGTNHDGDVQSLPEFRQKYRMHQEDPDLQDMHAAYPFVSIWDDHEVEDNYAGKGPDSAQGPEDTGTERNSLRSDSDYPRRVPFFNRRKHGYKAFFEAMPRMPRHGDPHRIYGSLRLGKMAELYLTDERQYRDPQPCDDVQLAACPDDYTPGRTYLGGHQRRWLKKAVTHSNAHWNLLASETMMMGLVTAPKEHANHDQWDGYSAEREDILKMFLNKGVENLAVLSGDIHTFIASDLYTTGETDGDRVGVELVGGSATSFGLPEEVGIPADTLETLRQTSDPHTIYADFETRGYCVVDVSKDELVGTFRGATTTQAKNGEIQDLAKFKVDSGEKGLQQI